MKARSSGRAFGKGKWETRLLSLIIMVTVLSIFMVFPAESSARTITANVVAFDAVLVWNRLGSQNNNGMMYALLEDTVDLADVPCTAGGACGPGAVKLRPDKRPRPLILRAAAGDSLVIHFTNWLTPLANPFPPDTPGANPNLRNLPAAVDEQVAGRFASVHIQGMTVATAIADDGSNTGNNVSPSGVVGSGGIITYNLVAEKPGIYMMHSYGATFGSEGLQGNSANGLFGALMVEPAGAMFYRSQVTEEDLRLATTGTTADGHPIINYEATYPVLQPWIAEGKAGRPIINMLDAGNNLVHADINAIITGAGGAANPYFTATDPLEFPLETVDKVRNPTVPNRQQPFREYSVIFHDEVATTQAFPLWYSGKNAAGVLDAALLPWKYLLEGVKDGFMINYGSGGIGSEIIANRLFVGPMHDCADCAYEEFFLTSFTVADPAMLVDIPANVGLEGCRPDDIAGTCLALGPKANVALFPDDPANIHHSYISDAIRFRNGHIGKEQHVFHLHNHQWLYSAKDDNGNYLDAQGIGPGAGYTYEINFGGSGNRNKSAGDAIFHCHFYPHFAQGMWEHWRNHDVFEAGTLLTASVAGGVVVPGIPGTFHNVKFALGASPPAPGARALPDGEIIAGTPIAALVPLPARPMAPMPAAGVTVKANPLTVCVGPAPGFGINVPGCAARSVGSLASIPRGAGGALTITTNPGYPFWVAGIEDTVGQRPTTPPYDMFAGTVNGVTFQGFDGGLPRHTLNGYAAGAVTDNLVNLRDFSKEMHEIQGVFYPETGTDVEHLAFDFHGLKRCHDTFHPDGTAATCSTTVTGTKTLITGGFITNGYRDPVLNGPGIPVQPGSVFHEPCVDDTGKRILAGSTTSEFFNATLPAASADPAAATSPFGTIEFGANNPRIYRGTNIQFDAVLNKAGYHFPQERIVALWQDALPIIDKLKPPEPLVMRINTLDCTNYYHSNLVPKDYETDDFQVRTPTDIIGQHIHLPKWDLTTTDGAANGWNYEDGTLSPGAVRERIAAIDAAMTAGIPALPGSGSAGVVVPTAATPLVAAPHPFFGLDLRGACPNGPFCGARTTIERWFADPVLNTQLVDRGLGIIFTHDHYGPSSHQQIGLYSTVLIEPAGSRWAHNETGAPLCPNPTVDCWPTSWQALIEPGPNTPVANAANPYREFYFEFSDFQHAYLPGVYVGADQGGQPLPGAGFGSMAFAVTGNAFPQCGAGGTDSTALPTGVLADTFRCAINPPNREQIVPVFPDLYVEAAGGVSPFCPDRPCPQAISVQDPGVLVVNYRNEPEALRVYDNQLLGPDGAVGAQAVGLAGDLSYALQSRVDRKFFMPNATFGAPIGFVLNAQPVAGDSINGTLFPPPINAAGIGAGDPFTPMMRVFAGDEVRVKIQAGGHEEEHNAMIHGVKWLQGGSGFGTSPNSGWRNSQAAGISEQFTFHAPTIPTPGQRGNADDYLYTTDAGVDGWWSGDWGLLRSYNRRQNNLALLSTTMTPLAFTKATLANFNGPCPIAAPIRNVDIIAVLANDVLPNDPRVFIPTLANIEPVTGLPYSQTIASTTSLKPLGGSLQYNTRTGPGVPQIVVVNDVAQLTGAVRYGPLNDPTAMMYVRTADLEPVVPGDRNCFQGNPNLPQNFRPENPACIVRLKAGVAVEPVQIRAAAGECINVTLRNKLPGDLNLNALNDDNPDLPDYSTNMGVAKRQNIPLVGTTTFNNNLIRPSSWVGIHPQLVEYDVSISDGTVVGTNPANQVIRPGTRLTNVWYAGDLKAVVNGAAFDLVATPVEFGGVTLSPADKMKQGQKGLYGALTIEPKGATWVDDASVAGCGLGTLTSPYCSHLSATVNGAFRDFSVSMSKHATMRYASGSLAAPATDAGPIEHLNGEGVGIPEDAQESGHMAFNYGTEPMWFRFGVAPNAPFGGAGTPNSFGIVGNPELAYSNSLVGVDPETPVFNVGAGKPFRMRVGSAFTTTRGTTFHLHGHAWERAPYLSVAFDSDTIADGTTPAKTNPTSFYQSGQESITGNSHFDIVVPKAGLAGDYLFRDIAGFGNAEGLWGILRSE